MMESQSTRQRIGLIAVILSLAWPLLFASHAVAAPAEAAPKQDATSTRVRVVPDVSYGPDARNVMDLYLPEVVPTPRPLVVCIHGGGWAGGDKRVYAWLAEALARRGYAAASVTYRFAPASRAPAQMDDVQRAVRWLRKNAARYGVDPERFGAIGGSAGGHLASYLALSDTRNNGDPELAAYTSRVQCAVDCYGPVNLEAMMQSASAPIVEGFIGKPLEGNEEDYRNASPHFLVKENPPPFLIIHGTLDVGTARGQVPIEQSVSFYQKLRLAGGDATLLKLDGAGHGFTGSGTNKYAQEALAAAARFFDSHLLKKGSGDRAMLLNAPLTANAAAEPPPPSLLDVVRRYSDTMIERGRDTYGPKKSGLLLSALDRTTLSPLKARPAPPGGIRREDRPGEPWSALTGANPHLDENLLRIMYALTQITGDPKYARVADEELSWFLKNAPSSKTSLLPWGEHMSWDVIEDKPIAGGNDVVHEFARPWVLWDRCFELAPEESRRFALGLWEHQIADHRTGAFDRHAPYFEHGPRDGKDFPRHAGFYIATWACAFKYTRDETFLRAIETLVARFERKRVQKDGTLAATIGPLDCETAAAMVPDPLAGRLRAFAAKEDELTLAELRKQIDALGKGGAADASKLRQPPLWQTGYSASTLASTAMFCLARYKQVGNDGYRDALVTIADQYIGSSPEEDLDAWPMAFAHAISTEAAAYRFTRRPVYQEQAHRLARLAVDLFWQDNPLPRASLKTGHYETITGADSLALALLDVHAISHELSFTLPSNTIDR